MKFLLISLLFILPTTAMAQSSAVKQIMKMAKEDNRTMQHLDILCNRFGGRMAGSPACEIAEKWAKKCFEEWGCEVSLEKIGDMNVGFYRGGWWGKMTGEENMVLHFATPSFTSGTKGPQSGHVVLDPLSQIEFDRNKHKLKGAWVLIDNLSEKGIAINYNEESMKQRAEIIKSNNKIAEGQGRYLDRTKFNTEIPALFYKEMVEAGVLGFIRPATVPINARYDRVVVREHSTFEQLPTVPDILLNREQFARIYQLATEKRNVQLEFDIRNYFRPGPIPYHNVVASIKGSKYPNEYVILGAHLDAFDVASGGVDCGNGVAAVMEAARMLKASGAKPDRTILFILFGAEEFGLRGSQAWVEQNKDKLDGISMMFNRDSGPLPYVGFKAPKSLVKEYEKIAEPIRQLYPEYGFEITELQPFARPDAPRSADHFTFRWLGVPAGRMTMKDVKGYGFDYRDVWHTELDNYQRVIVEYEESSAPVLALIALGTANLSKKFPREEVYLPKK